MKKKKYAKPYLIIEAFQLDTAVASCSGDGGVAINYSLDQCDLEDTMPGFSWFGSACENSILDAQEGNTSCYNAPVDGMTFLNS